MGAGGCRQRETEPDTWQGVIEHEERVLGFETPGRVSAIPVDRGATVRAGDLLAALDDSMERTTREGRQAEADAARARVALLRAGSRPEELRALTAEVRAAEANESLLLKTAARDRMLVGGGALPQASRDQTEAALAAATASREALEQRLREAKSGARRQEVDTAEAQAAAAGSAIELSAERIERHELRASRDGSVLDVPVEPGEIVGAGTPVVTLADTTRPFVDVFVPQGSMEGIRVGAPATVRVDAGATRLGGRVEHVARRTEFTPRFVFSDRERANLVLRVRVRVDDPGEKLAAGVPAFVHIERLAADARQAAGADAGSR
ncbi:MAG: HlyD family efflux transporter periplasmic adaptor subunit [Polyangiaceae bacterium]